MKTPTLGKYFYSLFVCLWLAWSAVAQAAAPTVSGFWPPNAATPGMIFVFGSDLAPGTTQVQINGINSPLVQPLGVDLVAFFLPTGNTNGPICITTSGGSACSTASFGATLSGVAVTGIWPGRGQAYTGVFVFGAGFDATPGKTQVSLAGAPTIVQVIDSTMLFFLVPPGGASGFVNVTAPLGSATGPVPFTVLPSVAFAAVAGSGAEGNIPSPTTVVPITVSLSSPSTVDITTNVLVTGTAVSGVDYYLLNNQMAPLGSQVTFPAGTTSTTLNLLVLNDPFDEYDETVVLTLSLPNNANAVLGTNKTFTYTIINDDLPPTIGFGTPTSSVRENGANTIPVTLSSNSGKKITVTYSVTGGSAGSGDYLLEIDGSAAPASGTLTFAPGVQTRNITVKAINDSAVEGIETIDLALSGGSNVNLGAQIAHRVDVYDYVSPEAFGDTAEVSNLASWSCGQNTFVGGCPVSTDTTLFQAGTSSIKFHASPVTSSLEPSWLRFRPDPNLNWDVSQHGNSQDYIYIEFWLHVKTSNPRPGTLRIGTGNPSNGNYFQFSRSSPSDFPQIFSSAFRALEASDEWTFYRIPLAGDAQWLRTAVGTPSLANIDYVELRADPLGGGFDAWVDGLRFVRRGTPPAPPAPLTARDPEYPNNPFDPDAIKSKVLVLSFNPILENVTGAPRANAFRGLEDPWTLAQRYINTLFEASRNPNFDANLDLRGSAKARYKIADFLEMDTWPIYMNGTQATDTSFISAPFNPDISVINIARTVRMLGLDQRAMAGEIDEVFWTEYVGSPGEAAMFGEGAFWINGPVIGPPNTTSTRAIPNILPNSLHCLNHRLEATQGKMFGSSENKDTVYNSVYGDGRLYDTLPPGSTSHAWNRFTMIDKQVDWTQAPKWIGAIGHTHFPVDTRCNLGYAGRCDFDLPGLPLNRVLTNADDWLAYPNMTCNINTRRTIDCNEWGCAQQTPADVSGKLMYKGFQFWSLQHMPHAAGANSGYFCEIPNKDYYPKDKGMLNNWWRYIMDVDQFKWSDGRLIEDWQPPTVRISAIEQLVYNMRGTTQWVPRHPLPKQNITLPTRVHGHVGVKVKVADENPIYRVDLYMVVDGGGEKYIATDTIRPYTFDWDTTGLLPGTYKLIAKAYDMPNGWEGVSTTVSVTVDPVAASYTPTLTILGSSPLHGGETVPGKINQPMSFTLYGSSGSQITYSAQNLPDGAKLNTVNGEGQFTWTPTIGQNGAQWIRFIATDAAGNSSAADVVIAVAQ